MEDALMDLTFKRLARKALDLCWLHEDGEDAEVADTDVAEYPHFMRLVLKNASWQQGRLRTEFEKPFESLRRSNRLNDTNHKENRMPNLQIENWLLR